MSTGDLPVPAIGSGGTTATANSNTLSPGRAPSHPPPVIPMKRSLSREPEPRIESPAPGAHHATPVAANTPEPSIVVAGAPSNRPVKTKARDKATPREGGREKKESWKKKEAQASAVRAGTPTTAAPSTNTTKTSSSKAAAASAAVANAPPALQTFTLPPPKEIDYLPAKGPIFAPVTYPKNTNLTFAETIDHPSNRKGFRYIPCKASRVIPSLKYHTAEVPPYAPRISYEDKSTHIHIDQTGTALTTEKGFRSARANVGVREGDWYYECKIVNGIDPQNPSAENGHIRLGFARRETSLDVPVGYDAYSYGVRDVDGQIVHMSRPKDFMKANIVNGDVIGLHISLPSIKTQREILAPFSEISKYPPDVLRDRVPIKYKAQLYFEQFEYMPTKDMEDLMNPAPAANGSISLTGAKSTKASFKTLPGSKIRIYKNGKCVGTAFEDLFVFLPPASQPLATLGGRTLDDGFCGYYPAVSVFRGGRAQMNFGPNWDYPPEDLVFDNSFTAEATPEDHVMEDGDESANAKIKVRAMCERYNEQIAEDVTYDIIDEVDTWFSEQKAAAIQGGAGGLGTTMNGAALKPEAKEIQEMHIDDE